MYRVIIADDEPVIRRGLRETIEWDALGLEIAGEAADGTEALELIREIRPEILITDIRMPEMDGIQLIREVRELEMNVKITILSGYSDYDYLKAAIRLGVDNYLLKPIDNEEKAEFLHIPLDAAHYLCAVCSMSQQIPVERREQFFRNIITEKGNARQMAFMDADGNLALLLAFDDEAADRSSMQQELDALAERAAREQGIPLMIGAGRLADGAGKIRDSYESAREALEYGAFLKNGGVIWSDDVPETSRTEQISDPVDYELMKGHIRKGEQEALKGYLEETLNAAVTEAGASHRQIRNLMMHIAVRMTDCFRTIYGSMNAFREPEGFDFARLFALRNYRDMQGWLFQLCDGLFAANRTLLGRSTSIVGMAVDYITEHFREGVTLRQVAADCHVNTSYLGQIFRKETGSAFTDYVNTLRIQEAGRLLADPTLKVYEIAQQVGFTDYHYFLKIFKKVTGRSPTDLRN